MRADLTRYQRSLTRHFDSEFETIPHAERLKWLVGISAITHSCFTLFGYLLSFPGVKWWWVEANYVLGNVGGYIIHYLGHKRGTGRWYQAHMEHHVRLYPPHRFLSTELLVSSDTNAKFYYPLFVSAWVLSFLFSESVVVAFLAVVHAVLVMLLCDYLHEGTKKPVQIQ